MSKNTNTDDPVFTFNAGQVRGAVFLNSKDDNRWFSTKVVKSYNDGTAKKPDYKQTSNFNTNDLADLILVSQECYKFTRTNYPSDLE